jgi:hypothetical protein
MSDDRWDHKPKSATKPWIPQWQSKKAPGTPQALEAIFEIMNKGNSGTGAFKFARQMFAYLSDEELWHAHDEWCEGRFDASVVEKKAQWEKKKPL